MQKGKGMIKAVLIDIDNTLLDFHKCAPLAVKNAFNKYGIAYKEEYAPIFLKINDSLWQEIENGTLTREELFKIRFKRVFSTLDIDFNAEKIETEFRKELFNSAIAVDGAMDMLKYLSVKYKLYAASNGMSDQQINRLKIAGMFDYFTDFFLSEKLGYQKPDKRFFDGVFKALKGILPSEIALIGDSINADIKGGLSCGIFTVWYNHNKNAPSIEIKPNFTIESLSEINKIL